MGKRFDLIKIEPQDSPIYLVVEAFSEEGDPETAEYWYDEGTCPVNVVNTRRCALVVHDNDMDPHGIFKYIRTFDGPRFLERAHSSDEWREVIPEAFDG